MNLNTLALLQWPQESDPKWLELQALLDELEPNQKLWLSGYLAASGTQQTSTLPVPQHHNQPQEQLTILYGSQTGNGEAVAKQLQQQTQQNGLCAEIQSLADFSVKKLAKKQWLSLVISTHGEGEAPDDAEIFYEQLFSDKAPQLTDLNFSVLALGDSSYELFCQTGKEIDERLAALGAHRFIDRIDCDVDFEDAAQAWIERLIPALKTAFKSKSPEQSNITALPQASCTSLGNNQVTANKKNPYLAEVLTIQKITGRGSVNNTYHIELSADPAQLQYQPGDSLAVLAHNDPDNVTALLAFFQADPNQQFVFKNHQDTLKNLLLKHVEITQISKPFINFLTQHIDHDDLHQIAQSHHAYTTYCQRHQLLDLLTDYVVDSKLETQDILNQLKSITPRLYSIASAQVEVEDEVHLTVALDEVSDTGFHGLASGLLCERLAVGDAVAVYTEPNDKFRLPVDSSANVIMIGPGTGVAPFRAFMQQRQQQQATGQNWLFFGNPHFSTDFLYQTEWQKLHESGLLTHIDLAFSRDQSHKIYVQHQMKQKGKELWQWLHSGAYIYVCGDATHMAKDVEQALIEIISEHGLMETIEAQEYLKNLKRNQQYLKDVY